MKAAFKNWLRGFAVLVSLSAVVAGLMSCSTGEVPQQRLSFEKVRLKIFPYKVFGQYSFIEYTDEVDLGEFIPKTIKSIEGFDGVYKEGTTYVILVQKYQNEETGETVYRWLETLSEESAK